MPIDSNHENIGNNDKSKSVSQITNESIKNEDDWWLHNDLYPERRGGTYKRNWLRTFFMMEGKEELKKIKCERNVYWCIRNNPAVKLMLGALKASGCEFDIRRHISCEVCQDNVSGGYDPELNQVVICHNVAKNRDSVVGTLVHEMIHMFDNCQNEMDFNNIRHLACTEIRAANLVHCSFLSAWYYGSASPLNIKATHRECVKRKALTSVLAVKKISEEEALKVIDEVFPKCYSDLEPLGRRPRRHSMSMELAYWEAPLYGYNYDL